MASDEWLRAAKMRRNIDIAEFVVMPNHVHGIIAIGDDFDVIGSNGRGTMHRAPTIGTNDGDTNNRVDDNAPRPRIEKFGKPTSNTIPTIVSGRRIL